MANCPYNIEIEYEWDAEKNEANLAAGRPGFQVVEHFDWETAMVVSSHRGSEMRWAAIGFVGERLYHIVFTERGSTTRIISLRLASRRERSNYALQRA